MSLVFGSYEANEIRRRDIANGVLSDCKGYGGTAPRPERDAWGNWIEYADDADSWVEYRGSVMLKSRPQAAEATA